MDVPRPIIVRRRLRGEKSHAPIRQSRGVTRKNRVVISEDEADNLICDRRLKEPTIPLEDYLVKRGYALAGRNRKIG